MTQNSQTSPNWYESLKILVPHSKCRLKNIKIIFTNNLNFLYYPEDEIDV